MAEQMMTYASWRWLWDHYIYEGLKAGMKHSQIRRNLVEAFRKEVFDQMMFRLKVDDLNQAMHTPENEKLVVNLTKNVRSKWMALVKECRRHPQTAGLLRESDLTLGDAEEEPAEAPAEETQFAYEEVEDPESGEYESPWDGKEQTAEWPELADPQEKHGC